MAAKDGRPFNAQPKPLVGRAGGAVAAAAMIEQQRLHFFQSLGQKIQNNVLGLMKT